MKTRQLIEHWPGLSQEDREALLSVISTRGKWKDCILANPPNMYKQPERNMAWNALIGHIAPVRLQTANLIMATAEEKALYDRLDRTIESTQLVFFLNASEPPYRWSMWSGRYDGEKVLEVADEIIKRGYTSIRGTRT